MSLQLWFPFTTNTSLLKNQGAYYSHIENYGVEFKSHTLDASAPYGKLAEGYANFKSQTCIKVNNTKNLFNNSTRAISIAFWVRSNNTGNWCLFCDRSYTTSGYGLALFKLGTSWRFDTGHDGQTTFSKDIPSSYPSWTHICFTWDGINKIMYVNGTETARSKYSGALDYVGNNILIGSSVADTNANLTQSALQNPFVGQLQDYRLYDHVLSALEVKQLSQGLAIHYTFDDILIEPTTNLLIYPTPGNPVSSTVEWDKTLHKDAITVTGWGYGYNNGVSNSNQVKNPQEGYHAMWQVIENIPTIVFNNLNSTWNSENRWLGISGGISESVRKTLPSKTVTISYEAKSTVAGMRVGIGLYHNITGSKSPSFYSGSAKYQNTTTEWKIYSSTLTVLSSLDTSKDASIYVYGHGGSEGTTYVRNLQMVYGNHTTPYTRSSRASLVYNEAGFVQPIECENITISSQHSIGKYSGKFNGTTSYLKTPVLKSDMYTSDYTLSFWVHPLDDGRAVYIGDHDTKSGIQTINFERAAGGKLRYYHNANPDKTFNDAIAPKDQWTMLTITYAPGTMKVYKNGSLVETYNHTASIGKDTNHYMLIGRDGQTATDPIATNATPLNGYIDDFRFYATVLGDDEILDLYNCGGALSDRGDACANGFIEGATFAGIDQYHNIQMNEIYEDIFDNEYEQLEYIESTGTQYIDTEYVTTSSHVGYELDMAWTGKSLTTPSHETFMGFIASSTNPRMGLHKYSSVLMFGANDTINSAVPPVANERCKYFGDFNSGDQKLYKNYVEIASKTSSFNHSSNTSSIYIFARNENSSAKKNATMRLYSANIYVNNALVRSYIPARRKSDNELGLYEIYTGKFCTKKGSGTFIAGPAVALGDVSAFTFNNNFTSRQIIEI